MENLRASVFGESELSKEANEKIKIRVEKQFKDKERFENLVRTALDVTPEVKIERDWYSLEILIFRVRVQNMFISISSGLLNALSDEAVIERVQKFASEISGVDEGYLQHCFIDQMFNINDIYEVQERIMVMYMKPAYCSHVSFSWENNGAVARTNINGSDAYFAMKDIKDTNYCVKNAIEFSEWVQRTQDEDKIEPFYTKNVKVERYL